MKKSETLRKSIIMVLILAVVVTFSFGVLASDIADAATKKTHLKETKIVLLEGQKFTEKLINSSGKTISASKVKWSSSAKSVAKVSSKGVVTAVADGTATITAKYKDKKYTAKVYVYDKMQADYDEIYNAAQAEHKALTLTDMSKIDMSKFMSPYPSDKDLITDEEVKSLFVQSDRVVRKVTAKEALEDIDLLFRTFKSSYSAYYYFGEENFKKAEENIVKWLSGKTTVKTEELKVKLREETSFVRDGHGYIAKATETIDDFKYEYFYCTNQQFSKDETGYYKTAKGIKWYFQSFSDDRVTMEPTLTKDGAMTYSPVLLCPKLEKKNCKIELQNSNGTKQTETISWKQNETYASCSMTYPNVVYEEEDGVAYVAVRNFWGEYYDDELTEFALLGKEAKDAEVLILDIRSNGGGNSTYPYNFFANLIEKRPEFPRAGFERNSKLNKNPTKAVYRKGKFHDNEKKIIVLTDHWVGSAGEMCTMYSEAYNNVLVIGSNTAGYVISGNPAYINLPNSRIGAAVPTMMKFDYEEKNLDGVGLMPDVWCNPVDALDYAFNMLEARGMADSSTVDKLKASIEKQESAFPGKVVNKSYTADAADFYEGKSDYVYIRHNGKILLKFKLDRDSSKEIAGARIQISDKPEFKATDRSYLLEEKYGHERIIDMLNEGGTYYIRVRPTYTVDGKSKGGKFSETKSFKVAKASIEELR